MPAFALISSRSQARRCGACWCSESCSAFAISNSSRCSTRSLGKYGARWDRCASRRRKKRDGASELAAERRERAQKAQPAHAIRGRSDVTPELIMLRLQIVQARHGEELGLVLRGEHESVPNRFERDLIKRTAEG